MEKNKILMIVIIVLLVVLLGGMALLGITLANIIQRGQGDPEVVYMTGAIALSPDEITLVPLSRPISTNLRPGVGGGEHVIQISLSVGVNNTSGRESENLIAELTEKESIIRSTVLGVIRNKTFEEMRSPEGKDALVKELSDLLRTIFRTNLIFDVYVDDLFVG